LYHSLKNLILPVVLYGYKAWFLTLRKNHKSHESENRAVRKILGPKKAEVGNSVYKVARNKYSLMKPGDYQILESTVV
jgi:hypothetical protein